MLEPRCMLAADAVVISEILALNESILADEDGEFSDWVEVYNPNVEEVDLQGWSLSDDQDNLDKWIFPAVSIPPKQYLLVFASMKDRRNPDSELHSNFKLSGDGEYIAISNPNGQLVSDFSFPQQTPDESFGFAVEAVPLFDETTQINYRVPTEADAAIGLAWTANEFDDAEWTTANEPVGFDKAPSIESAGFERGKLDPWPRHGDLEVINSRLGIKPAEGDSQLIMTTDGETRFSTEVFIGARFQDLNALGNGDVVRASATKREFTVEAFDRLTFDWNFVTSELQYKDFAFLSVAPGLPLQILSDVNDDRLRTSNSRYVKETGYQQFSYVFAESGTFTVSIGVAKQGDRTGESGIVIDNFLINGDGDRLLPFHELIATDISDEMLGQNSSLWIRKDFQVQDAADFDSLNLSARYDDGFVAYLNGALLTQDNAPANLEWNSDSLSHRANYEAVALTEFGLEPDLLQDGPNTLAIQILNRNINDEDLLVSTKLVGIKNTADKPSFLTSVTPGEPNNSNTVDATFTVDFSHDHGFYDEPFFLELLGSPETTIRFTTDGSAPTISAGNIYSEPVLIDGSTVVRAVQYTADGTSSKVLTRSYLFLDDVISQSTKSGRDAGFPNFDFEMDPDVIGPNGRDKFGGKYLATIRDDLMSLPTMALTMNVDDLFGRNGIYSNPFNTGSDWERPTSIELFYPNGESGFQLDAGIRIQGGVSRSLTDKKSFRVQFKRQYGPTSLKYPLFGDSAPDEFDSITLRSSGGEHLVGIHYLRDTFVRDSQIATGQPGSHSTWVHLYINGLYWGMYNPSERVDDAFAATYNGGDKDEYDVLQQAGVSTGSDEAWRDLNALSQQIRRARDEPTKTALYWQAQGRNPDGTSNLEFPNLLDVENFIDYMIVQAYAGNRDWPGNNYATARRRGDQSDGFQFYVWDAEFVLDQGGVLTFDSLQNGVAEPWPGFLTSDAFRVQLSDRIHKHFSPGGVFYVNPENSAWNPEKPENNVPASRYAALVEQLRSPIVPETARWGDERAVGVGLFTRDEDWQAKIDELLNDFFPVHSETFLKANRQYYRRPPNFVTPSGKVAKDSLVEMDGANPIYFTTNGTDPMLPNGSVSLNASLYEAGIPIVGKTTITARQFDGTEWSSFETATYLTDHQPPKQENLRITEINYHPHDAMPQFGERNENDNQFEFIELTNISADSIDLAGIAFASDFREGIQFTFGNQILEPGRSIVIPSDRTSFVSRYGADIVLARGEGPFVSDWEFSGSLGDSGDRIKMVNASGKILYDFKYSDDNHWPGRADGKGSSLELADANGDYNEPETWRSSSQFGGTPGTISTVSNNGIVINEVFVDQSIPGSGEIEIHNLTDKAIDVSHWFVSDDSNNLLKFRLPSDTTILGRGYLVLTEEMLDFTLSQEDVWLLEASQDEPPTRFIDHVEFSFAVNETSMGRWPNASGRLTPMATKTLGAANSGPSGDFDVDGKISGNDLDFLCQGISHNADLVFDVNNDGSINHDDLDFLLQERLHTNYGDANLDGAFNSEDLVAIFQAAEYDDQVKGNSGWATGDWTCDGEFDSSDLVTAFQAGGYQAGAVATKPKLDVVKIAAALVFEDWDRAV